MGFRMAARGGARFDLRPTAGLVLALLASACTPAAAPPSATPAAASAATAVASAPTPTGPPVSLAVGTTNNILAAPFYIGVERGIYLKHGIDLKLNPVASGPDSIKGAQGGQFQFITNSWATIAPAIAQGVPFKLFSPVAGRPDVANYDGQLAMVVRAGVTVAKVADLKGLTIGVSQGTATETWMRTQLKNAGLDPDRDVKIVNVPSANTVSAIQSKASDATAGAEPFVSQILAQVPGSSVVVRAGGVADARTALFALASWMAQNPKLVEQVIAANLESLQYVRQHQAETATVMSRYLSGLDAAILTSALKYIDFDPRWSDKIEQGIEASSRTLIDAGLLKIAPKASDVLARDLLSAAERSYPQYFTDLK